MEISTDFFFVEGLEIISVVLIFIAVSILSRTVAYTMKRTGEKIRLPRSTRKNAMWVINLIFYSLAIVVSLYVLKFDVGTLLAGMGIFALAVNFAAQQFLSNIIAGFILIIEKPFKIGDMISFNDSEGWIEDIGLRSTSISTYDGNLIVVPNSKLIESAVVNSTGGTPETMLSVPVLLEADKDIETISKQVKKIPKSIKSCLVDKKHDVRIFVHPTKEMGRLKYKMEVLFWVKDSKMTKDTITEFTLKMKKLF